MDKEELIDLGYDRRFVRVLTDKEAQFIKDIHSIIPNVTKSIKDKYPDIDDSTLMVALKKLAYYADDLSYMYMEFEKDLYKIINTEIRDRKINSILSESKVYSFSDFNKLIYSFK